MTRIAVCSLPSSATERLSTGISIAPPNRYSNRFSASSLIFQSVADEICGVKVTGILTAAMPEETRISASNGLRMKSRGSSLSKTKNPSVVSLEYSGMIIPWVLTYAWIHSSPTPRGSTDTLMRTFSPFKGAS